MEDSKEFKRGHGSPERPLAVDVWTREAHCPDHPALTERSDYLPERRALDFHRYWDPEFARDEKRHVWPHSWICAGREEDIPRIGDRLPLRIGDVSYLVVRSGEDAFKAFRNACLHRGTELCSRQEGGQSIRCPYHGWEWHVDGRLRTIPSHWDFPFVNKPEASLPEMSLDRWGGFLFVNADPDPEPLDAMLGPIPRHFASFAPERRYTAARFRRVVGANWKVAQEAFMEAYHLYVTHPEAVSFAADTQTHYDIWPSAGGAIGRNAGCSGIPSMHAPAEATQLEAIRTVLQGLKDWRYPESTLPDLDPHGDLRAQAGAWHRQVASARFGRKIDLPDAAMIDSLLYFIYPNSCFWLSEALPLTYLFMPHGSDPEKSYFDVRLLFPVPEEGPRPAAAVAVEIAEGESVAVGAPDFGFVGFIFDQDMSNMPLVQRGMHSADPGHSRPRLGLFQEQLIQHWNNLLDRQIDAGKRRERAGLP